MAECHTLEKKKQRLLKPDLVVGQQACSSDHQPPDHEVDDDVANLYAPFLSHGSVSLVGQSAKIPIKMLRDTGATQPSFWIMFFLSQMNRLLVTVYYSKG